MDVKDAVSVAKQHLDYLYSGENIANIGLEEVEYDDENDIWYVTLGFSRPWEAPRNILTALGQEIQPPRTYKVVRIADKDGKVLSVKNREGSS
jgi:hypothetical protein